MNANPPAFDPAAARGLGIKPLASLRAHRRLALAVFVLVILAGIPLAWIKGQPRYVAMSTVQVAPRYMKNLKDDSELDFQSNSQYRQFVEHQARSVGRHDILAAAIESVEARGLRWRREGESARRAIERLRESLVVAPVADTYMMQISLSGARQEGLAELVNAVTAAYIARMKEEILYGAEDRARAVRAREGDLERVIRESAERRTAMALEVGVSTFNENEGNPHDKLLVEARAAFEEAQRARIAAEGKLRAFEKVNESDAGMRSVQDAVLSDPGLNSLKSSMNSRRAALAATMSGLKPEHPVHKASQAELAEIDAELARRSGELTRDVATNLLSRYRSSLEQALAYEKEMARILADREARSGRAAKLFNEALSLTADIESARKELDAVRERLNFLEVERHALGFVRLVGEALAPETPYGPGRKKLLLAVLILALLAATVAPVAVDMADGRVKAPGDAERVLRMPALGWMVEGEGAAETLFAGDQLRRMAAALARERDRHGTQVFALTAVKPGAGSTRLALGLAATLDALGFPTLVVEANAFRPDERIAGTRPGLAQALRGEAAPEACIEPAGGGLPARVRVGVAPGEEHLGRVDRLRGLLDAWGEGFAFILVDAPPLLLAADAEIILDRIGHALLVVEAGATTRGELARAGHVLEASAATAVGLIVNRVRVLEGGGYLRRLLVEFLMQRKYADFASMPAWQLQLQGLLSRLRPLRRAGRKSAAA